MKINWYYSLILSILALVGVSQMDLDVPNQEILVNFSSEIVSEIEAEEAIATIKNQLERIGASRIKAQRISSGLRITYYSTKDVSTIKSVFSQVENLPLLATNGELKDKSTDFPSDFPIDGFQFNFSELQQSSSLGKDFNGQLVDVESTTIRFFNPFVYYSFNGIQLSQQPQKVTVALKISQTIALAITKLDYEIPEVRAGPNNLGAVSNS